MIHAKTNFTMDYVPGELIIKLNPIAAVNQEIENLNHKHNATSMKSIFASKGAKKIEEPFSNIYKLSLPKNSDMKKIAKEYSKLKDVEYAEPNYIYHIQLTPNDENYTKQWAHQNLDSELAWDIETGNSGIIIAVIDTGVEWNHSDLAANIWNNTDEIPNNSIDDDNNGHVDDIRGMDFVHIDNASYAHDGYILDNNEDYNNNDTDPMDYYGHGTHVAGIAAAVTNNGMGIAGVCWNCKIMPVRAGCKVKHISSSSWTAIFENENIAHALKYAADNNASVISMSFGSFAYSNLLKDALDYAYSKGSVLIAAAGNANGDNFSYPAGYSNVIGVAAIDNTSSKAFFSNYGEWIDIAAPGVDILSTYKGSYAQLSGTSMATPYVSGIAGLLLSNNPTLTQEQIRIIIKNSAKPINSPSYMGYGRVNAYNAFLVDLALNANISSLQNHDPLTGIIGVTGTASGPSFINYSLQIGKGYYPENWTLIISSITQKNDESLAVFDTTSIQDGTYTIQLTVNSNNGYKTDKKTIFIVNDNSNCYSCGDCRYKLNIVGDGIVELQNDIQSCNYCLTINEENKTLECNSYKIFGCGISSPSDNAYWSRGVFINKNSSTLQDCSISEFDYGIYLPESSHHNRILKTNITFNWIALKMQNSYYNLIDNCSISNNSASGIIGELGYETIINSRFIGNPGSGIILAPNTGPGRNNISNNLFYENSIIPTSVTISVDSSNNDIGYNIFNRGETTAIKMNNFASYNNVHHNTLIRTWRGIGGRSYRYNQIVYNDFINPRSSAFDVDLYWSNFSNNRIISGFGDGATLYFLHHSHFDNNLIMDNGDAGLWITGYISNTTISHNQIINNKYGIFFSPTSNYPFNGTISYNNFTNNTMYHLSNGKKNITAKYNYWGTTNQTEIALKIFDCNDDPTKGCVDYIPYLNNSWKPFPINFTLSLIPGWNLISFPLDLLNKNVNIVFNGIQYSKIFTYDDNWLELGNSDKINETKGYWIRSVANQTLTVEGNELSISVPCTSDWNLVGHPYLEKKDPALKNCTTYTYNNTWSSYTPGKITNSLTILKPGLGYWVKSE